MLKRTIQRRGRGASLAGLGAVVLALPFAGLGTVADATVSQAVERAQFTSDGQAVRPDGWRSWIYVGAPLTPNALNGGEAPFPEFHNVYIEPSAFEAYQRTGEFPEGTQIA